MKTYFTRYYSMFHLWSDILLLNLSYFVTFKLVTSQLNIPEFHSYLNILLVSNFLWILCVNLFQLYAVNSSNGEFNRFYKLLTTITVHLALVEAFAYIAGGSMSYSENWIFTAYKIFIVLIWGSHISTALIHQYLKKAGVKLKKYVIIGNGNLSGSINNFYKNRQDLGYRFCGYFTFKDRLSQMESLERFIETERPDFIYCSLSNMSSEQVKDVISLAERKKTNLQLVPDYHGFLTNKLNFEPLEKYPIIKVRTKAFSNLNEMFVKRAFDLVFSSVVMLLGLPVFVLVMVVVKLTSKGPVFFLQERTGQWGKLFKIIKFRTMYVDAHTYGLKHSLGAKDPRLTPVGNFLRRSRLDELPQFLNVLKGEMSVVGPRPLYKHDVEMLMQEANHQFQKMLTIRPGITSIGQIKVGYATSLAENLARLKYDLVYLNSYSLAKDLYLILLTVQVVLLGKGR